MENMSHHFSNTAAFKPAVKQVACLPISGLLDTATSMPDDVTQLARQWLCSTFLLGYIKILNMVTDS